MATASVGTSDGQASALSVVLPLKWWGRWWLRAWFSYLGHRWCPQRRSAFETLDGLRFISAIRWSLLPPFDPPPPLRFGLPRSKPHEQRWQLFFESNFDGDWDEYLDTFAAVISTPLQSIIQAGIGFPGYGTPGMFKAYTRAYDHRPEQYVSGYPTLTAADIRERLEARVGATARQAVAAEGFGLRSPRWTTLLLPLELGREECAAEAARAFGPPPNAASSMSPWRRIHFVRAVILTQPSGSWLLLTFTHDGDIEAILRGLLTDDHDTPHHWLQQMLACVQGYPKSGSTPGGDEEPWWDDDQVVAFLLAHRPPDSRYDLTYCAYPGWSAERLAGLADDDDGRHLTRWPPRHTLGSASKTGPS